MNDKRMTDNVILYCIGGPLTTCRIVQIWNMERNI